MSNNYQRADSLEKDQTKNKISGIFNRRQSLRNSTASQWKSGKNYSDTSKSDDEEQSDKEEEQKIIDFKTMLANYREYTEITSPFDKKIIEDVMFINEKKVVALEYIIYQKKGGNIRENVLSAFQKVADTFSGDKEDYLERRTQHVDSATLKNKRKSKGDDLKDFINHGEHGLVEAMVSIWIINQYGQIFKKQEVSFTYNSAWSPTQDGKMMLMLSGNKKVISLAIEKDIEDSKDKKIELKAWNVKDLSEISIHKDLQNCLTMPFNYKLQSIVFAAENKIIVQKMKINKRQNSNHSYSSKATHKHIPNFHVWKFIDVDLRQKIVEVDNEHLDISFSPFDNENDTKIENRFIGLLVNEVDFLEKENEEEEEEVFKDKSLHESNSSGSYESDVEETAPEKQLGASIIFDTLGQSVSSMVAGGTTSRHRKNKISLSGSGIISPTKLGAATPKARNLHFRSGSHVMKQLAGQLQGQIHQNRLQIVLVYASNINEIRYQRRKSKIELDSEQRWACTCVQINLAELNRMVRICQISKSDEEKKIATLQTILEIGKQKFQEYKEDQNDFFLIPKNWFMKNGNEQNFEHQIDIQSNRSFTHFSFLNRQKRVYLAFDNTQTTNEPMANINLPKSDIVAYHVRNQQIKNYLILIVRVAQSNVTATLFYNQKNKKSIRFDHDYQCATIDVQLQQFKNNSQNAWQNTHLQSVSLTQGDQEIWMQTQRNRVIRSHQDHDLHPIETIERRTISQSSQQVFPILMYNIGQRKLAIQVYLPGQEKQFIYHLNDYEIFITHLEFNKLEDLGFYPTNLYLCASSIFAFLTLDKKSKEIIVNVLTMDPYYGETQCAVFQSTKRLAENDFFGKKDYDVMIKSFAYTNKENENDRNFDLKVITQYSQHLSIDYLKVAEIEEDEENDDEDEEKENSESSSSVGFSDESESEELDEHKRKKQFFKMQPIPLQMDNLGHIFYVTYHDGLCQIQEVNPFGDNDPICVYQIKTEECFGMCVNGHKIFFMNDNHSIFMFERLKDQKALLEIKELFIKDKDMQKFQRLNQFEQVIINANYFIQNQTIFFLHQNQPLCDGLMDAQELIKNLKIQETFCYRNYIQGPNLEKNGNQFHITFYDTCDGIYKLMTYKLPDSKTQILLADRNNSVSLSTFLNNGQVLVQIAHRFFIFNEFGIFLDEIEFEEMRNENNMNRILNLLGKAIYRQFKKYNAKNNGSCIKGQRKISIINSPSSIENQFTNNLIKLQSGGLESASNRISLMMPGIENGLNDKIKEMSKKVRRLYLNRMMLHAMSQNNYYFLFQDKNLKVIKMYKLKNVTADIEIEKQSVVNDNDESSDSCSTSKVCETQESEKEHEEYEFVCCKQIDFSQSVIIKEMGKKSIHFKNDPIYNSDSKSTNIKNFEIENKCNEQMMRIIDDSKLSKQISNDGSVFFFSHKQIKFTSSIYQKYDNDKTLVEVFGSKIHLTGEVHNFKQILSFPKKARDDVEKIINQEIQIEQNILDQFNREQQLLPKQFRNSQKANRIQNKINKLEENKKNIFHVFIFDNDLLLVQCGRYIEYIHVDDNLQIQQGDEFKESGIHFDHNIIISKIIGTSKKHLIQIVGKDSKLNLIVIITWDFDKRIEESIFQIEYNKTDLMPENFLIMGMIQKMNYYKNENHLFDLELNIPIQLSHVYKQRSIEINKIYDNQRKIFNNTTRSLGINAPNFMNFPVSRMDLTFWSNIEYYGNSVKMISENVDVKDMNIVYQGSSLYHYFAENQEIMRFLCGLYQTKKDEKTLRKNEYLTPLSLLIPDKQGHTALDLALKKQRTKSFELMVEMIEEFDTMSFSKMMISVIPYMVESPSNLIKNFFDLCICRPLLMQQEVTIPWPEGLDEFVFASRTSLVNQRKTLTHELKKAKLIDKKQLEHELKDHTVKQSNYNNDTDLQLNLAVSDEHHKIDVKRIAVEAIDINWIFHGDNMKNLIILLKREKVSTFFSTKAMRSFILLVWQKYNPAIIQRVFLPNMCYMVLFISVAYMEVNETKNQQEALENNEIASINFTFFVTLWLTLCFCIFSFYIEIKKIKMEYLGYLNDIWNMLDLSSNFINLFVITFLFSKFLFSTDFVPIQMLRVFQSIGCFFMWIKSLYWMRLFQSTAYFVTLIGQTFIDIKIFFFLMLIIIAAFSNVFAFMDQDSQNPIIMQYTSSEGFNAFLTIWLMMLGEFNVDGINNGPLGSYICWIFFILGSFMLIVVCLNMLIGIMTDTFSKVYSTQLQTSLKEKIDLMYDHIWLLDMRKEFQDQKYVIHICPEVMIKQDDDDLAQQFTNLNKSIKSKFDQSFNSMSNQSSSFEKNTRILLKSQAEKNQHLKEMVEVMKSDQINLKADLDSQKAVSYQILQAVNSLITNQQGPNIQSRQKSNKVSFIDVVDENDDVKVSQHFPNLEINVQDREDSETDFKRPTSFANGDTFAERNNEDGDTPRNQFDQPLKFEELNLGDGDGQEHEIEDEEEEFMPQRSMSFKRNLNIDLDNISDKS